MRLLASILAVLLAVQAFAVTTNLSTADDWQSAIQSFTGANTAIVAAGTYVVTNTLIVPNSTTISGPQDRAAIFTGSDTCRVIKAGTGAWLVGLTIRNGMAAPGTVGGASGVLGVSDAQRVAISNCLVVSNRSFAGNPWGGGATYADVFNSEISYNASSNTWGGGLGYATVSNSVVSYNEAFGGGGGGANVNAYRSQFIGNVARGGLGGHGGGLLGFNYGYAENCLFISNFALICKGGGTHNVNGRSNVYRYNVSSNRNYGGVSRGTHSNLTIEFNRSVGINAQGSGGGGGDGTFYDSIMRHNTSSHHYGGPYAATMVRCLVQSNHSQKSIGAGGAFSACVLDGNTAESAEFSVIYASGAFVNNTVINHADDRKEIVQAVAASTPVWNNLFLNYEAATNWFSVSTNAGCNFTNDPLFLAESPPWRLSSQSTMIDAGNGDWWKYTLDYYGREKPQGAAVDVGATEWDSEFDFPTDDGKAKKRRIAAWFFGKD